MRTPATLWAAAAFGFLSWCVSAGSAAAETLSVESRFHGKPLAVPAQLLLPEKHDGRLPAMIVMHGSGGVHDRERGYAREFNGLGIAAVIVDSFSPRGIKSTVRDQSPVSSYDMIVDAVSTLKALARRPEIDPARIGFIGFSKGGTVAVKLALRHYTQPLGGDDKFAVLIAMYPWCGDQPLDFAAAGAPLHMLLGENDTYAGPEACKEFGARFAKAGGALTLKVYSGAQHDWDVPERAHWSDAAGQNMSQCVYDEVSPGTWRERRSKIAVMENNRPTGNSKAAASHCMTRGVGGGYDAQAAAQSIRDIRGFVREAFRLP